MPTTINIRTLNDIDQALQRMIANPNEDWALEFDEGLILNIKVSGRTWDGLIDARVAKYVLELQRVAERSIKFAGPEVVAEKPLVKVSIKDGSTELEAKAIDLFNNLVSNMNEDQKFVIALVIIGCVFGGWSLRSIIQYFERRNAQLAQGDAVRQANEITRLAIEKIDPEKPVRVLINELRERDTIQLSSDPAPISKDEAKARYPRRAPVHPIDVLIDGTYQVTALRMGGATQLELSRGDHSFRAELSNRLEPADRDAFLTTVKAAVETGIQQNVGLQVDARVGDKVVHAIIVGIGKAARAGSREIADLLE